MNPKQGRSMLATPAKQDGLVGIINTINTMRQSHFKPVIMADFYCGSGENVIDGMPINGSPISMLDGLTTSIARMTSIPTHPRFLLFNDIVSERALDSLPHAIESWQREMGLPVNKDELVCYNKKSQEFRAAIKYRAGSAQSLCYEIVSAIDRGFHFVAMVDPNGPKDAPWSELRQIYDSYRGKSIELIIHISSTTLKRVAKAREATDINFSPMPDHISDMLNAFNGCGGWIREPLGRDQWTMLLLSKFPPRNGWNPKNGPRFLRINETEGIKLIEYLSTTKKDRGE